jgi:hypothetical protein
LPTLQSFGLDEFTDGSVSELDDVLNTLGQIEQKCLKSTDPSSARFKKHYEDTKKNLFLTLTTHEALLILACCKNSSGDWMRRLLDDGDNDNVACAEELFSAGLRYSSLISFVVKILHSLPEFFSRSYYLARFYKFSYLVYFEKLSRNNIGKQ